MVVGRSVGGPQKTGYRTVFQMPAVGADNATLCADSATPSETHGGLLRSPREPIAEHTAHGEKSGLRNIRMFLKPGGKIRSNNNVVVPTGFEPVFKP